MSFVRSLEVFKAENPGVPLRIYFLTYEHSVEHQKYLSAIRKEKECFEALIKQKATILVMSDQDGKSEAPGPEVAPLVGPHNNMSLEEANQLSRKGGGGGNAVAHRWQQVVVDVREFRSSLPNLLDQRTMFLHPLTLVVGDYILTPDIVVERKSISDLFGSFGSGRLYNQCESMTRHYKTVVLLIEFDHNRSFSLQNISDLGPEISISNIISKLVLLTLHFPRLRILWSRSPHSTADMFLEIKKLAGEQPDPEKAVVVGLEDSTDADGQPENSMVGVDILRKLPGVTEKNYFAVAAKCKSLHDLSLMSLPELTNILGPSSAKQLYEFINAQSPV
mmetsp:Transcript_43946/g.71489  ORF Transcript_43946/g.71489 Transcript_43946/m.71489 type:complete len:334 (+) Transcript_43946:133-1134(+)